MYIRSPLPPFHAYHRPIAQYSFTLSRAQRLPPFSNKSPFRTTTDLPPEFVQRKLPRLSALPGAFLSNLRRRRFNLISTSLPSPKSKGGREKEKEKEKEIFY